MKIALGGTGAFTTKHLDGLRNIDGVEVVHVFGRTPDRTQAYAEEHGIPRWSTSIEEMLADDEVEAVILATPTQMHAAQAIACMDAGKHVEVEIPLADSWADARAVAAKQEETGLVCMVGHTRRFNPSHQWIHNRVLNGEFSLQHLDVQTVFFRRTNSNAKGEPRSWTDHLLWHHAAHTVDIFAYQTGEKIIDANIMEGPHHPDLGIAMDMSIQMKTESGQLLTLALSFNNDGPLGTFFRYIGDTGTYLARYDDLITGRDEVVDVSGVDVSMNGIELQDREFLNAIAEGREPNSSVHQVMGCYEWLHKLEQKLLG